jgi:probable rRNA maturation factor
MIDFDNRVEFEISIKDELEDIVSFITNKNIELILVDDKEIQKLNKQFRNIDKSTDVLSFPINDMFSDMIGSVIISIDKVKKMAAKLGHSQKDELKLLLIHGVLHLVGYDHEIDEGQMREKEKEIINYFNLPKSLIIRSEEL